MLALTRKPGERILIGDDIEVVIVAVRGDKVRVAIQAPREIPILRDEHLPDHGPETERGAA